MVSCINRGIDGGDLLGIPGYRYGWMDGIVHSLEISTYIFFWGMGEDKVEFCMGVGMDR